MPTIRDVAKEANVSIATVSYVLNNRQDMVGEKTRLHVLKIAQALGYRPNVIAQNLRASQTRLIGYAWHQNYSHRPNLIMDQFIYQLARASEACHYHLLTFTHAGSNPIAVYQELIRSGRVDGFILSETTLDDSRIHFLMNEGFPFVSFGRSNPDWNFHWVDTDGYQGVRDATDYFIKAGHERIAFLGWPSDSLTGNYRLSGYYAAMEAAGLPTPAYLVMQDDYANYQVDGRFAEWDKYPPSERPTAIIAITDYVAVAAIRSAERFGYVIGETLSIIGFDDSPVAIHIRPRLSTIRQPFEDIAEVLVSTLDGLVKGETLPWLSELFAPQLIIRESSESQQVLPLAHLH